VLYRRHDQRLRLRRSLRDCDTLATPGCPACTRIQLLGEVVGKMVPTHFSILMGVYRLVECRATFLHSVQERSHENAFCSSSTTGVTRASPACLQAVAPVQATPPAVARWQHPPPDPAPLACLRVAKSQTNHAGAKTAICKGSSSYNTCARTCFRHVVILHWRIHRGCLLRLPRSSGGTDGIRKRCVYPEQKPSQ